VTYTLGPDHEVQTIREIFSMFLEQSISVRAIARILNERGLKHGNFGQWDHNVIRRILSHPKYTGCAVFNRYSEKLGARRLCNPPDQWVLRPNAFPAIVSQEVFDRTQDKLRDMVIRRSKDRLLAELRDYLSKYGAPLPHRTSASAGMASASTYVKRFGSMMRAYELIGHVGFRYNMASLQGRRQVATLRSQVVDEIKRGLTDTGAKFRSDGRMVEVRGCGRFLPQVAKCFTTPNGHLRWKVRTWPRKTRHALAVIRLQPDNSSVRDFVLLHRVPKVARDFTLSDEMAHQLGIVCDSVGALVQVLTMHR
jgi:hypothetical protein